MVSGDTIYSALEEIHKAQTVISITSAWAPHEGFNEAYIKCVEGRAAGGGNSTGPCPPPDGVGWHPAELPPSAAMKVDNIETRQAKLSRADLEAAEEEWWKQNTVL